MRWKKGQTVTRKLIGPGAFESEETETVLRVDKRGVWIDNGDGNDPSGPFDPKTGWHPDDAFGVRQRICA